MQAMNQRMYIGASCRRRHCHRSHGSHATAKATVTSLNCLQQRQSCLQDTQCIHTKAKTQANLSIHLQETRAATTAGGDDGHCRSRRHKSNAHGDVMETALSFSDTPYNHTTPYYTNLQPIEHAARCKSKSVNNFQKTAPVSHTRSQMQRAQSSYRDSSQLRRHPIQPYYTPLEQSTASRARCALEIQKR